jgi:hypothetical protein
MSLLNNDLDSGLVQQLKFLTINFPKTDTKTLFFRSQ